MLRIRDLVQVDVDAFFSYRTDKQVMVRDRFYGILFYICNILVLIFIIVFAIIIGGGAYVFEDSIGGAYIVKSYGGSMGYIMNNGNVNYSKFDYFDSVELLNIADPTTFSVPIIVKKQYGQINKCANATTTDNGWCSNPLLSNSTWEYYVNEYEAVLVTFETVMRFPQLSSSIIYTLNEQKNINLLIRQPAKNANTFSLAQIFQKAGITPSLNTKGGVIAINFQWNCFVPHNCLPKMHVSLIDQPTTDYYYRFYNTIRGGNLYRDKTELISYKFIVSAEGKAKAFSLVSAITVLSLGIPLFIMVPIMVDIIMICCSKNRAYFRKLKFKRGQDLSYLNKQKQGGSEGGKEGEPQEKDGQEIEFD